MRKKPRIFNIDFFSPNDPTPEPGQVLRHCSYQDKVLGYFRIGAVRQVQVRVSRGEVARYALQVERLPAKPPEGAQVTVWNYPPKAKVDRWSPLL